MIGLLALFFRVKRKLLFLLWLCFLGINYGVFDTNHLFGFNGLLKKKTFFFCPAVFFLNPPYFLLFLCLTNGALLYCQFFEQSESEKRA